MHSAHTSLRPLKSKEVHVRRRHRSHFWPDQHFLSPGICIPLWSSYMEVKWKLAVNLLQAANGQYFKCLYCPLLVYESNELLYVSILYILVDSDSMKPIHTHWFVLCFHLSWVITTVYRRKIMRHNPTDNCFNFWNNLHLND